MTKKEMIKRKQRKEFWDFADLTDARVLNLSKAEITPLSFVQVKDSQNYWISNYGRMVNNLRKYFYMHKTGNVHYTINLVDEYGEKYKKETSPAELVAEQFLERNSKITWIWYIDEDLSNNYYKNIIILRFMYVPYIIIIGKYEIFCTYAVIMISGYNEHSNMLLHSLMIFLVGGILVTDKNVLTPINPYYRSRSHLCGYKILSFSIWLQR